MSLRTLLAVALFAALASPALAAGPAVSVNTSYSMQVPAEAEADARISDQEKSFKRSMYERAARECEDLKATIALTCQIISINVSTQISRNPGSQSQLYVSVNVQMQATMK
jgi:hypothetical protein